MATAMKQMFYSKKINLFQTLFETLGMQEGNFSKMHNWFIPFQVQCRFWLIENAPFINKSIKMHYLTYFLT